MSRYRKKSPLINDEPSYVNVFEKRGVKYIRQYSTANLHHPTVAQRAKLKRVNHVWKLGDRFYKLAHQHYGNAKLWWIIAWYNQTPTEAHLAVGQVLKIPFPLDDVLSLLTNK